jgi:hypothetical protein
MLVNYTPPTVTVSNGCILREFASQGVARVTERQQVIGKHGDFELRRTEYDAIVGLPEPVEGTLYIVSLVVLQANAHMAQPRTDLVAPDTGASCVRYDDGPRKGQIHYVTGFCQ